MMEIAVKYDDGTLDLFDSICFTQAEPFPATNMLSEFVIETTSMKENGLWLTVRWHEAKRQEGANEGSQDPIARRRRGWRMLLAEAGEIERVQSVSINGAPFLQRLLGELVDVGTLNNSASLWLNDHQGIGIARRIIALFDTVKAPMSMRGADLDEIAAICGCTHALILQVQSLTAEAGTTVDKDHSEPKECGEETNWMEGLVDETDY